MLQDALGKYFGFMAADINSLASAQSRDLTFPVVTPWFSPKR
jgi:hypothetical protein